MALRVRDTGERERVQVRYVVPLVAIIGVVAVTAVVGVAAVCALFVAGGTFGVMICVDGLGKPGDLVQRRAPAVRR
jgi:UPF0716 family protein affecting phage T7 exclusion